MQEGVPDERKIFDNLKHYTPDEQQAKAIIETEIYPQFLSIGETTKQMKYVLASSPHRPEFVAEMDVVLENLRKSGELLKLSHKNQEDYNLVDKRWMRRPGFMKGALERGRLAMELDVRMDTDGTFWVSHATGARATVTPPYIHEMTTAEMKEKGDRFTVEEAFQIFSEYNDGAHKLILELKTLGPDEEKFPDMVANLKSLIDKYELRNVVAISSLSPGILMSVHETFPEMPLILNGGIVSGISYEKPKEKRGVLEGMIEALKDRVIPADKKWRAFGITLPWLGKPIEMVISASEKSLIRPDGEGTQTLYAFARLPDDLTNVLREQKREGKELGGMVSLSLVTVLASILDVVGASEKAKEMRQYYNEIVNQLGIGKMATTFGQEFSKVPLFGETLFKKLRPERQIAVFKKELGVDVMIYTKAPEEFAHELPDFVATYK